MGVGFSVDPEIKRHQSHESRKVCADPELVEYGLGLEGDVDSPLFRNWLFSLHPYSAGNRRARPMREPRRLGSGWPDRGQRKPSLPRVFT